MTEQILETDSLLAAARERGNKAIGTTILPPGLDQFTVYAGLIGSALELGKLIQTEERDLKVIGSHHEIEMARIMTAFKEVEGKMLLEFQNDESLREKTFKSIDLLIAAGQHEIALKFYERMMEGFNRSPIETIVKQRNRAASGSGSRLELK